MVAALLGSLSLAALVSCTGSGGGVSPVSALEGTRSSQPLPALSTPSSVKLGQYLYSASGEAAYEFRLPGLRFCCQFSVYPHCDRTGIKIDRQGNLYVPDVCTWTVKVYPRGSRAPSFTYTNGINNPLDVAVARNGNLYVLNHCCGGDPSQPPEIVFFHPNVASPYNTLPLNDSEIPWGLTLDTDGNLYVTVEATFKSVGDVYELPKGQGAFVDLRLNGLTCPVGDAIDATGDLVVFDPCTQKVSIYQPGSRNPVRQISKVGDANGTAGGYIAFTHSGKSLFVATATGGSTGNIVDEIDYASGKVLNTLSPSGAGGGLAVGEGR